MENGEISRRGHPPPTLSALVVAKQGQGAEAEPAACQIVTQPPMRRGAGGDLPPPAARSVRTGGGGKEVSHHTAK